jgi:hypothetical protein
MLNQRLTFGNLIRIVCLGSAVLFSLFHLIR